MQLKISTYRCTLYLIPDDYKDNKEEEWEAKIFKAEYYFALAVDPDLLVNCQTPKKMLEKLDERFLKSLPTQQKYFSSLHPNVGTKYTV